MTSKVRPPNKLMTLLFIVEPSRVLLGMKKRGLGAGRWNGFGGKVQPGETIQDAARREMLEESGLMVAEDLDKVGVMIFEFVNQPQMLEVHVYRTSQYNGQPVETEEMRPRWFNHSEIPFHSMWPDDYLWYPYLLNKKYFNAFFKFEGITKLLDYSISENKATMTDH